MGGETSRHRGRFRIVFYDIKVDFCSRSSFFVMMRGSVYVMPMCILYCILHIRMRLRYLAVPIGSGYVGVLRLVAEVGLVEVGLEELVMFSSGRMFGVWLRS